jgi:predicted nuclease with RNAse H fold
MRTVGVDLAAEPAGTAVATIDWSGSGSAGRATVRDVVLGADDDRLLDCVLAADKAGIDCPLGWPAEFVAFVVAHHDGHVLAPAALTGRDWRRRLAYRGTDVAVREVTGRWPLSVASDRIARPAMRAAGLLARLARLGCPVGRAGEGVVVEVYPAGSLRQWGLPHRGYKGRDNAEQLDRLVDRVLDAAGWLSLGVHEGLCRSSDHALDAVIAAMTAYAAARGLTTRPGPDQLGLARTEGWIAVPTGPLAALGRADGGCHADGAVPR